MPNPNVAPVGPQPESPIPAGDTEAQAALEQHLQTMLDRFDSAGQASESPERSRELENIAGEYVLGSLEAILMAKDGGLIEALLITKGARTKDGNWALESPLFTVLTEGAAQTLPTRLDGLRRGQYRGGARELHDGMRKHLRNLIRTYTPPIDARKDRRQQPPAAAA
ncbi:hypothetical protein HY635_04045 [Candidatus Uhrbacteria bacterium]|nr:hypothetical protein [Candidatus Uhrbacteria bacterium]